MMRCGVALALTSILGLSACAAPPDGPTVLEVPGPNKTLPQFQADDAGCRDYAQAQTGPTSPNQAARSSGVAGAAVGTAVGAAAGAAIGAAAGNAGAGAAVGAGTGLVLGAATGATNGAYSGASLQRVYDASYIQCMAANGNKLEAYPIYADTGSGFYADPYAGFGYGPYGYFGGPVCAFGFFNHRVYPRYGYRGGYWHGGYHGGWHGGGYPHGGPWVK
ncbi:glycine zipper family protein [Acidisoma sp. L85]|uniref:glycine zipper family protein n=1 Tax=Acidisoma sp. L85 TaxID=1641850 RepID=UPI00131D6413|nr:glycine zipper family protein [Acidisoma sp. L85]